jgi:hypothetical protein
MVYLLLINNSLPIDAFPKLKDRITKFQVRINHYIANIDDYDFSILLQVTKQESPRLERWDEVR